MELTGVLLVLVLDIETRRARLELTNYNTNQMTLQPAYAIY